MKICLIFTICLGVATAAPKMHHKLYHKYPQVKSLMSDFLDILDRIPVDQLKNIVDDHLATDGALAQVIKYFQGPEWAKLVAAVASKPEVHKFVNFLTDSGIPVEMIIGGAKVMIQNAHPTATPNGNLSLRPLLDDIKAVFSIDNLMKILNDKKENSPDFRAFYERISSDKSYQLVMDMRALDEVQRIDSRLKDMGVKVDEMLTVVSNWLEWDFPIVNINSRSLTDDLFDILALIPVDKVKAIIDDHLANDGALAYAIKYLQGPEWHDLITKVGSTPEVKELGKYLTDAGFPVDIAIGAMSEAVGNANPSATPDESGTLRPFLDEIEEVLPLDDMLNMLNDKMENSPNFKAFYKKISSEEAHQLLEKIRALDEVQRLASRFRVMDVKIDEAFAAIYDWLGWGKP